MTTRARALAMLKPRLIPVISADHPRVYVHVEDAVDLLADALEKADTKDRQLHECIESAAKVATSLTERAEKAEAALATLQQAECGTCGRSLPPDGDCYGCARWTRCSPTRKTWRE